MRHRICNPEQGRPCTATCRFTLRAYTVTDIVEKCRLRAQMYGPNQMSCIVLLHKMAIEYQLRLSKLTVL